MAKSSIYPAAMQYLSELSATNAGVSAMGIKLDSTIAETIATQADAMISTVQKLSAALEKHDFASTEEHMQFCAKEILVLMSDIRANADALEGEVSDDLWPLPKYREMLFIK